MFELTEKNPFNELPEALVVDMLSQMRYNWIEVIKLISKSI